MHANIMVRPQIAWSDALRACIPQCMQIIHTLDRQGLKRKEGSNGWKGRGREELQRKDGRNEMDELKGKEEQEEHDRRFDRKDGPNEMNAFK